LQYPLPECEVSLGQGGVLDVMPEGCGKKIGKGEKKFLAGNEKS
jgi:hypothetical protein